MRRRSASRRRTVRRSPWLRHGPTLSRGVRMLRDTLIRRARVRRRAWSPFGAAAGRLALLLAAGLTLWVGCGDNRRYAQAVCVLVDVSGTYADQKKEVVELVKKGILPDLLPGDSMMLMRIDSRSFEADNVVATLTLDTRPSHANAQKLAFAHKLDAFAAQPESARFTDIRGSLMLAADYLRETGAGTQTIVVFSDMQEDLPRGTRRELDAGELDGMRIVAVNVKRLQADNADPSGYRERLSAWKDVVLASGAREWQVIVDGPKLVDYLEKRL